VAGVCTPDTEYPDICPSGTSNCNCITMNAAKVRGSPGGNGVVAFDQANLTTTVGKGNTKTTKTDLINLLGALCVSKNGRSPATLTGGWGIAASPASSPEASGLGGNSRRYRNGREISPKLKSLGDPSVLSWKLVE
jgi:hypothetical protein